MKIDVDNAKIELIQWLTTLEDRSLLQKIIDLKQTESKDWWNKISEAEKESIKSGILDSKKGKLHPNTEAQKIYEKWL